MATELATAYLSLIPTLKGAGKRIQSELDGVNIDHSGKKLGKQLGDGLTEGAKSGGSGIMSAIGGIAKIAGPALAAIGFSQLVGEAAAATDATQKFKSTLDFAGLGAPEIEALSKSTRKYADETVYALSDIQNITAQLAANSVPNYDKLAEAAGNLNAVAGGNAETFSRVGLVLTQTAGAGKLTTENWNQLADAIPGASGKLQEAMRANGAYTGDFRDAMAKGQITAEEFNQAIMDLGFEDAAIEAAKSTATFEGAFGNLRAAAVGGISDILTKLQPAITGAINGITPIVEGAFTALSAGVGIFIDKLAEVASKIAVAAGLFGAFKAALTVVPALSGLSGKLSGIAGTVGNLSMAMRGIPVVDPGIAKLSSALSKLMSPATVAVAGIAALAAAFAYFYATNDGFRETINSIGSTMMSLLMPALQSIGTTVGNLASAVLPMVQSAAAAIAPVIMQVLTALAQVAAVLIPLIAQVVATVLPVIATVVQTVVQAATSVITMVMPVIESIMSAVFTAMPAILAIVTSVLTLIMGIFSAVWPAVQAIVEAAMSVIQGVIDTVWPAIQAVIDTVMNGIKVVIFAVMQAINGDWEGAWNTISSFLSGAWDGIGNAVSTGIDNVVNFFANLPGNILGALGDLGSLLWDAGSSIIDGLWGGLKSAWGNVTSWFGDITSMIPNLKGPLPVDAKLLVTNGEAIMGGLLAGLGEGWGDVESYLSSRTGRIPSALAADGVAGARGAVLGRGGGVSNNIYIDGAKLDASPQIEQAISMLVGALAQQYDMGIA